MQVVSSGRGKGGGWGWGTKEERERALNARIEFKLYSIPGNHIIKLYLRRNHLAEIKHELCM